jgi:hypothetical protein
MRAAWDGEVEGVVAPAGPATVTASFPYLGLAGQPDPLSRSVEPIDVTLQVSVVESGIRLLSPGQAIDAALSDPRFAAWLASADISAWQGVNLEADGRSYIVVLTLDKAGSIVDGKATVDRRTGQVTFTTLQVE